MKGIRSKMSKPNIDEIFRKVDFGMNIFGWAVSKFNII